MATQIAIAVEDSLSECVFKRLISVRRDLSIIARYPLKELPGGRRNPKNRKQKRGLSGWGQIKVNLPAFNQAAHDGVPIFVLTDLDVHVRCAGQLIGKWLGRTRPHPNLVFRVAVKEVEAWLLADSANLAHLLAVSPSIMPTAPEALPNPKQAIVDVAKCSTSPEVVNDMVPLPGSTAEVGRSFDRVLSNFAIHQWDFDEAAKKSPSLARALAAIRRFTPK